MTKTFFIQITFLFILSAAILFPHIGGGSLSSWDEAVYAQAARGIIKTGNWIDLYFNGGTWLDKPPLHIWVVAVCYKVFGINEFSARVSSVLFGICTIIGLYLIVLRQYDKYTAFISSLVLLSTLHFIRLSRLCMSDTMLAFLIMLSLYFFWRGIEKEKYFLFSGILFGIAIMTKWVAAFLIPFIIVVYIISSAQFGLIKNRFLLLGFIAGLMIALPWHTFEYLHNKKFIEDYLSFHILRRVSTSLDGHTGNWMFYIKAITNKGRPWGIFGLLGLPYLVWHCRHKKEEFLFLILVWVFTISLIFSIAKTKLHWYIIPVYPALSVCVGMVLSRIIKARFIWVFTLLVVIITFVYIGYYDMNNLDFNKQTKSFSIIARRLIGNQRLYISADIGDPGVGFYFGDGAIWGYNTGDFKGDRKYFLAEATEFKKLTQQGEALKLIAESGNLTLFSNK